nr:site-specific integrase [Xanthomonas hyacinthi]
MTPTEILPVLREVEARGSLDSAGRLLQRIRKAFNYAVSTGRIETNPVRDLDGALTPPERGHHAALPWAKVPDFLKALAKYPGNPETRIALHLMLLIFVRSGELRGARWSEFEPEFLEATGERLALWTIPAERMKSRRDHIVPLAPQVVALFRQLHEFSGNTEFVLPHRTRAKTGMSESTLREGMHRIGFGEYTVHGFRALASTELDGLGFRPDVIERQLAHVEANRVRAAYHRTDYLEDRQRLMIKWADIVTLSGRHEAEVVGGSKRLEDSLPPLVSESTVFRQRRRMMVRGLRKTRVTGSSYKSTQPHGAD